MLSVLIAELRRWDTNQLMVWKPDSSDKDIFQLGTVNVFTHLPGMFLSSHLFGEKWIEFIAMALPCVRFTL